jgi:SAM-dependent methyltransferase
MTSSPARPPHTPQRVLEMGTAYQSSKVVLSAVELGLFTELGRGPATADQLRDRLGLHERGARDFLDVLVALGLLQREADLYSNCPDTGLFLDRAKPTYLGGILEMSNDRLYPFWGRLTDALRTGLPQNEVRDGEDFFGGLYQDAGRLRHFLAAMDASAGFMGAALARLVPWEHYRDFVDVGGARGGVAAQVVKAHPHLSGGCFDLPPVEPVFDEHMERLGTGDRVTFYGGDFFTDSLPETDVIIFGHVLHDWDADQKRELVRKAYDALRPGGAVLVYDAMIDDDRRDNVFGLLMSLNMLIETPGGFEYTARQCESWLRDAGFVDTSQGPLAGPDTLVIGHKPSAAA